MATWSANFVKNYWQNHRNDSSYDWYNTLNYAMNEESAAKQMSFQDYMSSTAHQRETDDLMKAGLNPILSANNGAATGSGAYASVDNSSIAMKQQQRIQTILQNRQLRQDKKLTERGQDMNAALGYAQIANQQYMNKYATDMGYQLGISQAAMSAGAVTAAAAMNAAASRYGADQSRAASEFASLNALEASKYTSDNSLTNSREQREYDNLHPSNPYQLGGSILSTILNTPNNVTSAFGAYSSAK